jgi:hypothetical protein
MLWMFHISRWGMATSGRLGLIDELLKQAARDHAAPPQTPLKLPADQSVVSISLNAQPETVTTNETPSCVARYGHRSFVNHALDHPWWWAAGNAAP